MERMLKFWVESGDWANKTFGSPGERGPIGPLKHILKEAKEIEQLLERMKDPLNAPSVDEIAEEMVDLQHLIFDVCRRLDVGVSYSEYMTFTDYVNRCFDKLNVNRERVWPRKSGDNTEAVEHKRDE